MDKKAVGKRIKCRRMIVFPGRGGQKTFACALGIHQNTVANYEAGRFLPKEDRLLKMAELLKTHVGYLLGVSDALIRPHAAGLARSSDGPELERLRAHVYQCWKQEMLTTSKLAELLGMDIPATRQWCLERGEGSNGLQEGGNCVV